MNDFIIFESGNQPVEVRLEVETIWLIKHYNLDAIISLGYRVSSTRATRFRQCGPPASCAST